jgi:septal ring factor EnvC (AmiA/AmiB activator)
MIPARSPKVRTIEPAIPRYRAFVDTVSDQQKKIVELEARLNSQTVRIRELANQVTELKNELRTWRKS